MSSACVITRKSLFTRGRHFQKCMSSLFNLCRLLIFMSPKFSRSPLKLPQIFKRPARILFTISNLVSPLSLSILLISLSSSSLSSSSNFHRSVPNLSDLGFPIPSDARDESADDLGFFPSSAVFVGLAGDRGPPILSLYIDFGGLRFCAYKSLVGEPDLGLQKLHFANRLSFLQILNF